jgi:acetyl esterase/lipase
MMKFVSFDLYNEYSVSKKCPDLYGFLDAYLVDDGKKHPAILVCPGGGYEMLAGHEITPVAQKFVESGFNAFVLKYSLAPNFYPVQLSEAVMAMDFIKSNALTFNVVKDKVACLGFSAGGHLASCLATIGCDDAVKNYIGKEVNARPDASLLLYPVINLDDKITHAGTSANVSGGSDELKTYLSTEKRVDKSTPPTFIATTATDTTVPAANTLRYADALAENDVNFELHVFPEGWHGMGLGDNPETPEDAVYMDRYARWQPLAVEFLKIKHGF